MAVQLLGGAPASLNTGSKQQALEDPAPLSTHRSLAQDSCFSEQMTRFPTKGFVCLGFYSKAKVQKGDPAFGAGIVICNCNKMTFVTRAQFSSFIPNALTAAREGYLSLLPLGKLAYVKY